MKDESLETGMSQRSEGSEVRKMEELEAALQQFAEIGTTLSGAICHAEVPIVDRCFISGLLSSVRGKLPMRQIIRLAAGENEE